MKYIYTAIVILLAFTLFNFKTPGDCPEGINQLPMYGNVKKCKQQIEADQAFLKDCDEQYQSRKLAAKYFVGRGWSYFYKNKLDTAMFRFNQAWLLDSLNADVYWGFGNIEGMKKKYKESLLLFHRSIHLNPDNGKVYESASSSLGQLFMLTKNMNYLDMSVVYLKDALKHEPDNARIYAGLTTAFAYYTQKDSAKKYLKIADKLAPNSINPQIRRVITGQ